MKELSLIIPALNEELNIEMLHRGVTKVLKKFKIDYEIIFVDDGSTDNTLKVMEKIRKKDKNVKIISFLKNYGKAVALQSAFDICEGKYVIQMDADMQDDPYDIIKIMNELKKGWDFINGWKTKKHPTLIKRAYSWIYNLLTSLIGGIRLHDFNCAIKGMKREVAKSFRLYGRGLHRYTPILAKKDGFKVKEIKVKNYKRKFGKSKFSLFNVYGGFLDLLTVKFLTGFSSHPLHLFGAFGFGSGLIGAIILIWLFFKKILGGTIGQHMPLLMLGVLLFIMGIQFFSMGFIAELITKIRKKEKPLIKKILK